MLGPDEGALTWFAKGLITFKAKDADTRGIVSFFQCDVPYGWQAPVHKHANESELFYITEGALEVFVKDTVHDATPGCVVWIPPSTPHSIFVRTPRARGFCYVTPPMHPPDIVLPSGDAPARGLCLLLPGNGDAESLILIHHVGRGDGPRFDVLHHHRRVPVAIVRVHHPLLVVRPAGRSQPERVRFYEKRLLTPLPQELSRP
jgi:mannose-6-phosphate isomerase-like protein (cupin superfamily)